MAVIKTRKIGQWHITLNLKRHSVSIVGDWRSNYGIIYIDSIGKYNHLLKCPKQIIGMETVIANKEVKQWILHTAEKHHLGFNLYF